MKLPIYAPDTAAPAGASPPALPLGAAGVFGEGLSGVARGGMRVASALQEVEEKAQRGAFMVEMSKLSGDFTAYLAGELDKVGPDHGDPEINQRALTLAGEAWIAQRVSVVTDPFYRQQAEAALRTTLTQQAGRARTVALARTIEQTQAEALEQARDLRQRGTPEALVELQAFVKGLTAAEVFSAEAGERLLAGAEDEALANWWARTVEADPADALARVDKGDIPFRATDVQIQRMRAGARSAVDDQERRANAKRNEELKAQDRADKIFEQEWKAIQEATEDTLRQKMRRGESIAAELEFMGSSGTRELSPEGQRRLMQESDARTADRKVESDAATAIEASIRARSVRVSPADRTWLRAQLLAGKLSVADFDKYDDKMVQNLKSGEDETKAQVNDRHQQAEQRVRAGLGITGLLEVVDQGTKKAYDLALEELTNRSARYDGTEDPLSVADEIIPKYKAYIGGATTLSREGLARAAQALDAQYQQGLIPEGRYRAERSRLLDMARQAPVEMPPAPQSPQSPRRR